MVTISLFLLKKRIPEDLKKERENCRYFFSIPNFKVLSMCVILLSILIACLETVEILGIEQETWATFELVTNCWFLVELLLRFIVSPNKSCFLTEFSNWVNSIAVVPYFVFGSTLKI